MAISKIAVSVPDPRFYDWGLWSSSLAANLRGFYSIESENNWRRFARAALEAPPFNQLSLPQPDTFPDWRAWGFAVMTTTAGGM